MISNIPRSEGRLVDWIIGLGINETGFIGLELIPFMSNFISLLASAARDHRSSVRKEKRNSTTGYMYHNTFALRALGRTHTRNTQTKPFDDARDVMV